MSKKCPKCNSEDVEIVDYMGSSCIVCKSCGYDETLEMDIVPEERTSQKEKARHSPYKTGGGKRTK